jgi:TPR repeat protein
MTNSECPVCLEFITIDDIEGSICFTCNTIYCNICSNNSDIIIKNVCPVCRQRLQLGSGEELFSLINITTSKLDYLHLGIVYSKIAKKYINDNLTYSADLYLKSHNLGVKVPYLLLANKFYEKRQFHQSLTWFGLMGNNSYALLNIGKIHIILKNKQLALENFKKSALLGRSEAICCIGLFYQDEGKFKRSVDWYLIGKKMKDSNSINNLAISYKMGRGVKQDDKEAFKLFKMSAKMKNPTAEYNLNLEYSKKSCFFKFFDKLF